MLVPDAWQNAGVRLNLMKLWLDAFRTHSIAQSNFANCPGIHIARLVFSAHSFEFRQKIEKLGIHMEYARALQGHFKQHAFVWRSDFGQRQPLKVYQGDDRKYVEYVEYVESRVADASGGPVASADTVDTISTNHVIDRFVNNHCQEDIDRYLYKSRQVEQFLGGANMESLRASRMTHQVSKKLVLLDDRNNSNVTREELSGDCRPFLGPLNAHQLYSELLKTVSQTCGFLITYTDTA